MTASSSFMLLFSITTQSSQASSFHQPVSEESSVSTTSWCGLHGGILLAAAQGRQPSIAKSPRRVEAPKTFWLNSLPLFICFNAFSSFHSLVCPDWIISSRYRVTSCTSSCSFPTREVTFHIHKTSLQWACLSPVSCVYAFLLTVRSHHWVFSFHAFLQFKSTYLFSTIRIWQHQLLQILGPGLFCVLQVLDWVELRCHQVH